MRFQFFVILSCVVFCAGFLMPGDDLLAQDSGSTDAAVLKARAERPVDPVQPRRPDFRGTPGPGDRLFRHIGPDNAECVRSIADINGDGLDEVIVGYGESGTDNVFCLSGASVGLATVLWSIQTDDGVSGGSVWGDQSIVPISDPDDNGYQNILLGTAWGGRTAYNLDGLDGSEVWLLDTYLETDSGWVYSLCELNDITGDGVPECAFGTGSYNDSVYLIDGASSGAGTVIWQYHCPDAIFCVRDIGDVNGDGDNDVLAAVGDNGDRLLCLDGGTINPAGNLLWQYVPGDSIYSCGVLPDITGDDINEAIAVLWELGGGAVRCINGASGATVWTSEGVSDYAMQVNLLEDVTGDGVEEIVVSSWENAVEVVNGFNGATVWKTKVGTLNGGDVWTARAIDDLNGDGRQDVIAGSFDYHVYAMDGDTGEIFWAYNTNNRVYSVYPIGDLDGDGSPEVVAGTQDTTNTTLLHVLDGNADIPFPNMTLTTSAHINAPLEIEVTGIPGWTCIPAWSKNQGSTSMPPYEGLLELAAPINQLPKGPIGQDGVYVLNRTIPNNPNLIGKTYHFQALVRRANPVVGRFSDLESITIVN